MRGRLGMRRTFQTKCDRSRCHVVCFGLRLSVVRDFVAREDLERLQLRRPTCLQAPQNRGSFQKEHVTHSLLFFEITDIAFGSQTDKVFQWDGPVPLTSVHVAHVRQPVN